LKNVTLTRRAKQVVSASVAVAVGLGYCVWQNNDISVTRIEYENAKLTSSFAGFRIAQISDLHGKEFGRDQKRLLDLLRKEKPDIIVLTGDFIDSYHRSSDPALALVRGAVQIAPVFWVPGNHEAQLPTSYSKLRSRLILSGVTVLENSEATITRGNQTIRIAGILDPLFVLSKRLGIGSAVVRESIKVALGGKPFEDEFVILLSHRPEYFGEYMESGVDLVLSGHAHGGQWRFFGQGVYAPDQGLFPEYTAGAYREGGVTMVVSRGLGNVFPVRIANRPDLVIVTFGGEEG